MSASIASDLPPILTAEEARHFLRLGRTAFYEAVRTGQIPALRVGRLWRIHRDSLLTWLARSEEAAEYQSAANGGVKL